MAAEEEGDGAEAAGKVMSTNAETHRAIAELMKTLTLEAVYRAGQVAHAAKQSRITPADLEKILPQLLLDFS